MKQFDEYFKAYYIAENYSEYIECCQKEKYNSLIEYAELLEVIGALKFKIKQSTDVERKIVLKIYNIVFENQPDKFVEYTNNVNLIK